MPSVGTIHNISNWIAVIAGVLLNSLLIFLILKKSVRAMKWHWYSHLLDRLSIDTGNFIIAIYVAFDGYNCMINNGLLKNLPPPYNYILIDVWFFGTCYSTLSNCVPFVYRYFVLCKSKVFSIYTYFQLLLLWAILSMVFVAGLIWAAWPEKDDHEIISDHVVELNIFLNSDGISNYFVPVWMKKTDIYPWLISAVYVIFIQIVCYAIILYCAFKVRRNVSQSVLMNYPTAKAVEVQLQYILFFQTLIPAIETVLNWICLIYSTYASTSSRNYYFSFAILFHHYKPVKFMTVKELITVITQQPYHSHRL
ncbi:serpentine type 7TM GPCR chemoreceptor str domain-containing protein [Ditylenchus destructor]|uniref:Serpentine type 7TM GPCR chemoreceptor str domain-containing protein n=1 Tax=Ditylenchus destructor TaxID=166010 RepID=A0AAD4N7P5_9BILA|nr:serpentine type 7TM GPCR chemoreceptor str domain-containing protein [Ditylenchus destructor]